MDGHGAIATGDGRQSAAMQRLDPTSLNLFVGVVEAGTISAAAERAHIAAAAISKRLAEMEATLGTALLLRTNKGVEPTAAGQALLSLARRALHELDQIPVQMQSYASGVRGLVRVSASMSAVTQFLPGDLQSFLTCYPDVHIQLEERTSSQIQRWVRDNAADVGIYTSAPDDPQLHTLAYRHDRLVVCLPKGHRLARRERVAFDDMADENIVGMHAGSAIGVLLARAALQTERLLRLRFQVTNFDALCMMVHHGLGVGVLPEQVARRHAVSLDIALAALDEPWARRQFSIALRQGESASAAASLLATHLNRLGAPS